MNQKNRVAAFVFSVPFALFLGLPVAQAATAVGAITGSFSPTPTGQATYTIPLPAPGGAGGLSPNLSIEYASGSGLGLLGWGWSIGGLSVITRCSTTWAYDGSSLPVTLTTSDKFCLDGSEMSIKKFTTGTYGDNGTTYVTTPSSLMEEISYTSDNATGPQYFDVLHPDGSVWEYGKRGNSEVTATNASGQTVGRVWALDRITDAYGNQIQFQYTQPSGTGAYYLTDVYWGGNSYLATPSDHSYEFTYSSPLGADATASSYVVGNKITWNERITSIALKYNNSTVLSWTPNYLAAQDSNRSRLASLTECDANGNCFPATQFTWQHGTPGFGAASNTGQIATTTGYQFVEDINGDGRQDLVYDCGGVWCVRFGQSAGGFGGQRSTGVAVTEGAWAQPIHYLKGSGDQILVDDGGYWQVISWNGSGFTLATTGVAVSGEAAAADINGNGYDDLVTYSGSSLVVRFNQSNGGKFGSAQTAFTYGSTDTFVGFRDVGADASRGLTRELHVDHAEIGVIGRVKNVETICLTDGCGSSKKSTTYYDQVFVWNKGALVTYGGSVASSLSASGGDVVALDINGDGLEDLVPSGTAALYLNNGDGFTKVGYSASTSGLALSKAIALDYNDNGRDDLLVPDTATGYWALIASNGSGFDAPVDTSTSSGNFLTSDEVIDTEGRMLADLVGDNSSGDIELSLRSGPYPDLLSKVTDGFGNYDTMIWVPLSNSTYVQTNEPAYSGFEIQRRGAYVLSSVHKNNGIGGEYVLSYDYNSPERSTSSGFVGFYQVAKTDNRNRDVTTSTFGINQFAVHIIKEITLAQPNGDWITDKKYTFSGTTYMTQGQPIMPKTTTITNYDINGNRLNDVVTSYSYDQYHVLDDLKTTTNDLTGTGNSWVTDKGFVNAESFSTSAYCLKLKSSLTVTNTSNTLPSGSSQTRENTYSPDFSHCKNNQTITNANLATALQTTTHYTYGSFGNPIKVTVTGHNPDGSAMASRVTQYAYDNNGEFVTQITDAAGDVTKASWDGAFGVKDSETAVNGSVTSYSYDGFGRLSKTILPTGASTQLNYYPCSGNNCNSYAFYIRSNNFDASGQAAGTGYVFVDQFGRTYAKGVERLGGKFAYSYIKRNGLGEVISKSLPYYGGDTPYYTNYTYDALGRVKRIATWASTSATSAVVATYDGYTSTLSGPNNYTKTVQKNALGQITQVTDADGNSSTYTYGTFGELTQIQGADGLLTKVTYNAAGYRTQLSGPDRGVLNFTPDSLGEVVNETNARGQPITMTYGPLGRMTDRSFPNPIGSGTELQKWTYSTSGNSAGRLGSESDNVTGFSRTLTYNSYGDPTTVTETLNGTALAMNMSYDSLGRISSVTYPVNEPLTPPPAPASLSVSTKTSVGGSYSVSWSAVAGATAYKLWELKEIGLSGIRCFVNPGSSTTVSFRDKPNGTYQYTAEACYADGACSGASPSAQVTVTQSHGTNNSCTTSGGGSTTNATLKVDYTYDSSGNLDKVTNAVDGTVYWQPNNNFASPAMNALGQMEAYILGGSLDVERLHDAATGAVTSITSGPNGSGNVLNLTTSYNQNGSRNTLDDLNEALSDSYQYDSYQRLTKVTRTTSGGSSSSSFNYQSAGQFNTEGPAGSYAYTPPRVHSPSSTAQNGTTIDYSYNADGDRTHGALYSITWDALGKARSITSTSGAAAIELTYGPDGGLVDTTNSTGGGRYLGTWLKWTSSTEWSARILALGRVIAVVKDSGGSISSDYLLRGPLGSTDAVATGTGTLVQRIAYGAWGRFVNPATETNGVDPTTIASTTTVTYTGHELIAGAGVINMGARLYDPRTGLFMSPDPTVAHPYDTQDLNQYSYVVDNPLTFIDSKGLSYSVWHQCIGSAHALYNNGAPLLKQLFHSFGFYRNRGGALGMLEAPGTANVDPAQFGLTNSEFGGYAPFISGTITSAIGSASFNGVTDVIGGKFGDPVPGMNTRTGFESKYPGELLIELNSGPNLGDGANIDLKLPSSLPCPAGTHSAQSSNDNFGIGIGGGFGKGSGVWGGNPAFEQAFAMIIYNETLFAPSPSSACVQSGSACLPCVDNICPNP